MKKHPQLLSAFSKLSKQFHVEFKDTNVCSVSINEGESPFAHLIIEESFNGISLSLATDFSESYLVAELVITLMYITPITLLEPFYIDKAGNMHFGQDSLLQFEMECNGDLLKDIKCASEAIN